MIIDRDLSLITAFSRRRFGSFYVELRGEYVAGWRELVHLADDAVGQCFCGEHGYL